MSFARWSISCVCLTLALAARGQPSAIAPPLTAADRALLAYQPVEAPWPSTDTPAVTSFSPVAATAATQRAVAEAVLVHLLSHNESAVQSSASRVCLSVFGADPPAPIVSHLASKAPAVPASACTVGRGSLFLRVGSVRLLNATHAEATGGYYEGPESAAGHSYWLTKRGGQWVVVGDHLEIIS